MLPEVPVEGDVGVAAVVALAELAELTDLVVELAELAELAELGLVPAAHCAFICFEHWLCAASAHVGVFVFPSHGTCLFL